MISVGNIDELRSHAQPVARFTHATFQHRVYLQLASDLADVLALSLESKGGSPRRHAKRFDLRQRVDDFLSNAIAEKFVLWVIAHVNEGKDGDALFGYFGNSSRCNSWLFGWRCLTRQSLGRTGISEFRVVKVHN